METKKRRNRKVAVRAALREAEKHLLGDQTVCVKVYQALGLVSVIRDGRKPKLLARFMWDPEKEEP